MACVIPKEWVFHNEPSSRVVRNVREVADCERLEKALRESKALSRSLLQAIDDAASVKDLKGRYLAVNAEFLRREGREATEILGKTATELYGPGLGSAVAAHDAEVLSTGRALDIELDQPGREGTRTCHLHSVPTRDSTGRIVGLITVSRDITESKEREQRLLQAQKLEAAGRIAGEVAHDFANLLTSLISLPDLIKRQLPPDHPAADFCALMGSVATQMAAINEDLLALSRRGRRDTEILDLNDVVRQAVRLLPEAAETVVVELDLSPDLEEVRGAGWQLIRVFANLLSNARDSMNAKERRRLLVRTENVHMDTPIGRHTRVAAGAYVRVSVSDTGCGIPAEIQDRIFDAFFSTKRADNNRGTGLGLAIVRAILADHSGYIDLESEVGLGTTFTVYLPSAR